MLNDLLQGGLFLLPIGAGVALIFILGRDRDTTADVHDLADYHEPEPVDGPAEPEPVEAPDGTVPPLCRQLLIDRAVPTLSDAAVRGIAAEMLQEIAAEQQARAGIQPAVDHWAVLDGSCYDDCPACARDMTGSFAVLAVA